MLTDCQLVAAVLGDSFVWSYERVSLTASAISVQDECLIAGGFAVLLDDAQVPVVLPCVWPQVSLDASSPDGKPVRLDPLEVGMSMMVGLAIVLAGT